MDLDELRELIETLQQRIEKHGSTLQASEMLTRYALIDPLLRALGWDTGDPSQVVVEYKLPKGAGQGFADYALLGADSRPRIVVEAKSLRKNLDVAAAQALNYCNMLAIPYFAVTDGERWRIFDTFQPVPLEKKLVVELNLQSSTAETCLNALALWRPSAVFGSIQPGEQPVVVYPPPPPPPLPPPPENCVSVSKLKRRSGEKFVAVQFPDKKVKGIGSGADLTVEIVRWLKANKHITDDNIPITLGSAKSYFINSRNSRNPEGLPFANCKPVDSWFVNTNYNIDQQIRNARNIIEKVGLNSDDFCVRTEK